MAPNKKALGTDSGGLFTRESLARPEGFEPPTL